MKSPKIPAGVTVCRCYIRVSSDDQEPEVQQARMQAYCDGRGWFPVRYVETAKGTKNDRPEFLRAVSEAMAGLAEQPQAFLVAGAPGTTVCPCRQAARQAR